MPWSRCLESNEMSKQEINHNKPLALAGMVLTIALAMNLTGCASNPASPSVADVMQSRPELSTAKALFEQAGLSETLRGRGPLSVFVPTNEAFRQLSAEQIDSLKDPTKLKAVLGHHIIAARVSSTDIQAPTPFLTLDGSTMGLAKAGDYLTADESVVTEGDIPASNGLVHLVDGVLKMPRQPR